MARKKASQSNQTAPILASHALKTLTSAPAALSWKVTRLVCPSSSSALASQSATTVATTIKTSKSAWRVTITALIARDPQPTAFRVVVRVKYRTSMSTNVFPGALMASSATSKLTCVKSAHPPVQHVRPPWTHARVVNQNRSWSGSFKRLVCLRALASTQWQSATYANRAITHAKSASERPKHALFAKITWSSIELRTHALRSAKKKLRSTIPTEMMGKSTVNNAIKSAQSAVATSTDVLSVKTDIILTSWMNSKTHVKIGALMMKRLLSRPLSKAFAWIVRIRA